MEDIVYEVIVTRRVSVEQKTLIEVRSSSKLSDEEIMERAKTMVKEDQLDWFQSKEGRVNYVDYKIVKDCQSDFE